jgi:flavin reductase (DIM6/NTAB) family NADH-FMN oxidoreductase RutF
VSLLGEDHVAMADAASAAATSIDKFADAGFEVRDRDGVPALADCDVVLWCRLEEEVTVNESVICVGRVESAFQREPGKSSLIRAGGRYHALGRECPSEKSSDYPL